MVQKSKNYSQQVKLIRQQLVKCGFENGFTHEKTIRISKQLDRIITKCIKNQVND